MWERSGGAEAHSETVSTPTLCTRTQQVETRAPTFETMARVCWRVALKDKAVRADDLQPFTARKLTNFMEQSPYWEASWQIPCIFWNLMVHYSFYNHLMSLTWARRIHSTPFQPIPLRSILTLSSHLCLGLPVGLSSLGLPPNACMHLSSPPYVLHSPPISFFSIWSAEQYLACRPNHEAHHHAPSSQPLLSRLS